MATFRGSYKHSIDHKGRVSIPARFRRLLSGDASETFVVLRGLDACVSLFPADEFKRLEDRLRSRSFSDPTHRRYQRHMLLDSRDETLDAQGRVAIPPSLIAHAALKKEVLVNGVLDHIELWKPENFKKYIESKKESYEKVVEQVMGNRKE